MKKTLNKKTLQIYCYITLLLAAIISGLSFVAQKDGMNYIGAFTFNTLRAFIGSITLIILILIFKILKKERILNLNKREYKTLIKGGIICGTLLFIGLSINQICMIYSPAGKAGFITSLYIIFVPLFMVFLGKKLSRNAIYGVIIALIGLFLLCFKSTEGFEVSDVFLTISAIFFALQMIAVDKFAKKINPLKFALAEFLVLGFLSLPFALIFENPQLKSIIQGILPVLFAGIFVTAGGYTFQNFGQKATNPTTASLILSSEAVFATLGGILLLNETLSIKEILGCTIIFIAILISQK